MSFVAETKTLLFSRFVGQRQVTTLLLPWWCCENLGSNTGFCHRDRGCSLQGRRGRGAGRGITSLPSGEWQTITRSKISQESETDPVSDIGEGAPLPTAQNFLDFMQFFGNFDKIVCCRLPLEGRRPHLQGILDPPLWSTSSSVWVFCFCNVTKLVNPDDCGNETFKSAIENLSHLFRLKVTSLSWNVKSLGRGQVCAPSKAISKGVDSYHNAAFKV